jgi:hypothetical protein
LPNPALSIGTMMMTMMDSFSMNFNGDLSS